MKKVTIANVIFILVFLSLIILPLVFADYKGGEISNVENRYLAVFPKIIKNGELTLANFQGDVENWINDNAGGRSFASSINADIQYDLFHLSTKSDVMIGKDNCYFYYTNDILNDFIGNNIPTKDELDATTSQLQTINDYLKNKGIMLDIVFLPDKKTIYPELYPDGIINPTGIHRIDTVLKYINDNSSVHTLDIRKQLSDAKSLGNLYNFIIDNAHWNYLGGFIGYENICEDLHEFFPNVHVIKINQCKIDEYTNKSIFNNAIPVTDVDYKITTGFEDTYKSEPDYLDQFSFLTYNEAPDTYKKHYVNEDNTLPKLLFIGDSYTQRLFEYFPQSFSEVTFLHSSDLPFLPNVIDRIKPDIVVIESVERMYKSETDLIKTCSDKIRNIPDN